MARNMLVLKYKCVIKLTCVEWPEPAINKEILMGIKTIQKAVLALALVALAGAANSIERLYGDNATNNGSGKVTYTSLGQTLTIVFDNTSVNTVEGSGDQNSSIITGLVFDIDAVINSISSYTFSSSAGTGDTGDLTSLYSVKFDTKSNIVKGSTKVDLEIATITGANGGIYNSDSAGDITGSVFPDLATLVLTIDDPASYSGLAEISGDILRMQRVGLNGAGSLKLPGYNDGEDPPSAIPEPGILSLLGLSLAGVAMFRRRQS